MANGLLANAQESHTDLLWAGSGGFDTVHHDDTLTGMGTELYPLGVNSAILNDAPWLSAAKEIAPTQTLQPGQYIQALSSLTVSGYKNHCVAVKGGGFIFPTVDQLKEWVGTDGFLPTSSFENYTAYNENNITNLYNSAGNLINSSYYLIDNKLDTSASGFFYPMTGNPSGFLTEHQSLEDYYLKTDTSSKEEISAALKDKLDNDFSGNFYPMTGNPSGFLTEHQDISHLATKDELLDTSSFLSASISSISSFVSGNDDKYYPLTGNPSGFLTEHQDLSDYATTSIVNNISSYLSGEIDNKLDKSESANYYPMTGNPSGFLTEHQSLEDYYKKTETSSKEELSAMFATFSADETYTLVPGYNIGISSDDNLKQTTIYYTGTNGDEEVNAVVRQYSAAGTWLTESDSAKFYPMTGNPSGFLTQHQSLTNYYTKNETSSKQEISDALSAAGRAYTGISPIVVNNTSNQISANTWSLSAGNGISFVDDDVNKVTRIDITGADFTDYYKKTETSSKQEIADALQYVSSNAGKTYNGISPIDVNNETNQISAKGVSFGVQEPLFFVQDDNEAVIIGCSAGGGATYTGDDPIYVNNTTNHIGITGESLSAGPNIDIFSSGGYVVISATSAAGGTTYTGDAQGALDEVYANSGVWLTAHQPLTNYYIKTETSSKQEISAALTGYQTKLDSVNNIVYTTSLPATPDANTLYLIPEA